MNFFLIDSRQDYASYTAGETSDEIDHPDIPALDRRYAHTLVEYLGNPPRKAAKRGSFHMSGFMYFVDAGAKRVFEAAARERLLSRPVKISGRESERFDQIWITNYIDCLDLRKTVATPTAKLQPGKIGVIKRPFIDEKKWDGSDLFVVPQDSNFRYFCTERFVVAWTSAKLKGIMFSRHLFDPCPILC